MGNALSFYQFHQVPRKNIYGKIILQSSQVTTELCRNLVPKGIIFITLSLTSQCWDFTLPYMILTFVIKWTMFFLYCHVLLIIHYPIMKTERESVCVCVRERKPDPDGCSSVGKVGQWRPGGHGFNPCIPHKWHLSTCYKREMRKSGFKPRCSVNDLPLG